MANDAATTVIEVLCTCQAQPLGLPFTLTTGCLVHDRCVCHEAEHGGDEGCAWCGSYAALLCVRHEAEPVPRGDEGCAWCGSYVALLKVIGSLDEAARVRLKLAYLEELARG